jgi:hypothetical protein
MRKEKREIKCREDERIDGKEAKTMYLSTI